MTPDELRNCLRDIRWTPQIMADVLGCDADVVEAWLDRSDTIPPKAKVWINMLALLHWEADQGRPATIRGKKRKPRQAKG